MVKHKADSWISDRVRREPQRRQNTDEGPGKNIFGVVLFRDDSAVSDNYSAQAGGQAHAPAIASGDESRA